MAGLAALSRFGVLAVFGAGLLSARPAETPELSAAQRDSVDRGDMVMHLEQRATSPWPAVTSYLFVDATPEEVAAVFTDYESHATFVPATLKSKITRIIDRSTAEVSYTIAIPVLSDEDYTVRDHISRPTPDSYRVDWALVRASSTKASMGHALFQPYINQRTNRPGTLLEYYNFVTPGSILAGLPFIRNRSVHTIGETAKALARQAEIERGREVEMRPRLTALRSAVAP